MTDKPGTKRGVKVPPDRVREFVRNLTPEALVEATIAFGNLSASEQAEWGGSYKPDDAGEPDAPPVQLGHLAGIGDRYKQAFACSEAEQRLANALADLALEHANDGVRPAVFLELAAIILARTAHDAVAHQNRGESAPIDPERAEAVLLSYVLERASRLIAERRGTS